MKIPITPAIEEVMNSFLSMWHLIKCLHSVRQSLLDIGLWRVFYTLAEGIMISVRSLQRRERDVSITRRVDLAMSVCPFDSTQTSLSVLKLSGWNFSKSLISFAGSILVGTSRIGQLNRIAPIGIIGKKI